MPSFRHEGFDLNYIDVPAHGLPGEPVLLIHGFASSHLVNWVGPGWIKTLTEAGYRAIALDNRGHGLSSKSYDPADYPPGKMAGDAAALLSHLGIDRAHVFGYSMGARIAAFLALQEPAVVASLIFGGLGIGMVEGLEFGDDIQAALLADDPATVTHPRGRTFRAFADQTKSDRKALAACMATSREIVTEDRMARITQPTLVAVGTRDDIGGSPDELAALMPNATSFAIEGRDHTVAVGDRTFKQRVLGFLADHPL